MFHLSRQSDSNAIVRNNFFLDVVSRLPLTERSKLKTKTKESIKRPNERIIAHWQTYLAINSLFLPDNFAPRRRSSCLSSFKLRSL